MTPRPAPAIFVLSQPAAALGRRIADHLSGTLHGLSGRLSGDTVDEAFAETGPHLRRLFCEGRPIVAVMAAGALVRLLAPVLADKHGEPPVVAVSEDGASVVPLLGGHRGANDLARAVAALTGGHAAVTTAGDIRFGVALDDPPAGYVLANPAEAKAVMAELVAGASVRIAGEAPWLAASGLPFAADGSVRLTICDKRRPARPGELVYRPKTLILGIGAERGAPPAEAVRLAEAVLEEAGLAAESVAAVVSLDVKADEPAVHAVADRFAVPARFFPAGRLEAETPRLATPSDAVFAEVGCHGVAEGAALAAAGPEGRLVVAKRKGARVTAALAQAPAPVDLALVDPAFVDPARGGRARGRLFIVGIGPGSAQWRSPEASRMIEEADDLVGYGLYLDLLGRLAAGRPRHDFALGEEEARVRHAMELAGTGRTVALVSSGDAGIYAMATLAFELLDRGEGKGGLTDAARRIAIAVAPGISALQAAAARIGAPLGHDFCTISLSDLLTPWPAIERRIAAAAEADFVIAFYNPVSRRRRTQLAHARAVLLRHRPADTPVVLATNLGRPGERVLVVRLEDLCVDDVDMLTVVIVGSSESRVVRTGDGREWVYTPRGYAGKAGGGVIKERTRDEDDAESKVAGRWG